MQPLLIRVLERRGQRGHYLTAVAEVASNLGPLLAFADTLKAASFLDGLFELVEIQWPLVDTRKASETVAMLLVKFGELVQVVEIGTCSCLQSALSILGVYAHETYHPRPNLALVAVCESGSAESLLA
jgi:hypothetical protein